MIAGVTACAGSGTRTASRDSATATGSAATIGSDFSTHKNDRDNDGDQNDDDEKVLAYGHAADAADRRTSIDLVTHYFAAAAAADGAKACASLVPFIAESVPEDDGHQPGLRGKTCAVVMSKLFKLHHQLLTMKNTTLRVIGVRVERDKALAILAFPTIPEVRQITERRVGSAWRLLDLFDGILE